MRWSHLFCSLIGLTATLLCGPGCTPKDPEYGHEQTKALTTQRRQIWAVAPAINLSGEKGVDPFLQADLVFQQLQQVRGVTVIPVNRVAEVYAALRDLNVPGHSYIMSAQIEGVLSWFRVGHEDLDVNI